MNHFYASILVNGIQTLLEFHYQLVADQITILEYFDQHGDEPDLTFEQLQLVCDDIRRYEYQRPLQVPDQMQKLLEFQFNKTTK